MLNLGKIFAKFYLAKFARAGSNLAKINLMRGHSNATARLRLEARRHLFDCEGVPSVECKDALCNAPLHETASRVKLTNFGGNFEQINFENPTLHFTMITVVSLLSQPLAALIYASRWSVPLPTN